jgi:uncharacterized repeat protein (TIGR03803 family)
MSGYVSHLSGSAIACQIATIGLLLAGVIGAGARITVAGTATETVLYRFAGGADGAHPVAALLGAAGGVFYGTTQSGGSYGYGTVFKLIPSGSAYTKTTLYNFAGGSDGATPLGSVIADSNGTLYGTTSAGGNCSVVSGGCGTVFALIPTGAAYAERILHRFGGHSEGLEPMGTLIADTSGALYGTTAFGGLAGNYGTAFRLVHTANGYVAQVLYRFRSGGDGANPIDGDGLLPTAAGTLFGTTRNGGSSLCASGCGTVFSLTPEAGAYNEHIVHRFTQADGANPSASVIIDASGALYGTTEMGGQFAFGTVFRLAPTGLVTDLHAFSGVAPDGFEPTTRLIGDAKGALYGTTAYGGSCDIAPLYSCGNIFKLTPTAKGFSESILVNFSGGSDGAIPQASLITSSAGTLYGTTAYGGGSPACIGGCGTIYKVVQ